MKSSSSETINIENFLKAIYFYSSKKLRVLLNCPPMHFSLDQQETFLHLIMSSGHVLKGHCFISLQGFTAKVSVIPDQELLKGFNDRGQGWVLCFHFSKTEKGDPLILHKTQAAA